MEIPSTDSTHGSKIAARLFRVSTADPLTCLSLLLYHGRTDQLRLRTWSQQGLDALLPSRGLA